MELVRFVFRALLLAVILGLIFEFFVPGGGHYVDVATAVLAAATWLVPLAALAYRWNRWPKFSLATVGIWISIFAFACSLSVMAIALAVLTCVFAHGGEWAWRSLAAVAGFWVCGVVGLWIAAKFEKPVAGQGRPRS
jgi:hypothetical protein